MSIHIRVRVNVYCDGATHQGLELTAGSESEIKPMIRRFGWTISRDGKTYCPEHKPKSRLKS